MSLPPELAACARLVEEGDPLRFAATMAAPVAARARLWPLYALNLELARAAYASNEPMICEMRLQWWLDQLAALGSGGRAEGDVATALAPLIGPDGECAPALLPLLTRMAEARRREIWREPFADKATLFTHLDETAAGLMWGAALLLGAAPAAEVSVRQFGCAAGLASWLRAVPALKEHGHQPLPDPAPEALADLAREGVQAIRSARTARHLLAAAAQPALWPGWQAGTVLSHIAATGRLPANEPPHPARQAFALTLRRLTGYW
ncbi:MAG: squalene/phytoene synthase family protein [Paracoccaceae bacterium]